MAKLLKALCDKEEPTVVICGKQAIDDDANQTGQMLAALMGWPQATFASRLRWPMVRRRLPARSMVASKRSR